MYQDLYKIVVRCTMFGWMLRCTCNDLFEGRSRRCFRSSDARWKDPTPTRPTAGYDVPKRSDWCNQRSSFVMPTFPISWRPTISLSFQARFVMWCKMKMNRRGKAGSSWPDKKNKKIDSKKIGNRSACSGVQKCTNTMYSGSPTSVVCAPPYAPLQCHLRWRRCTSDVHYFRCWRPPDHRRRPPTRCTKRSLLRPCQMSFTFIRSDQQDVQKKNSTIKIDAIVNFRSIIGLIPQDNHSSVLSFLRSFGRSGHDVDIYGAL